jgi:catechol 2,3-dioxygenase-like lactoylglutathione lyase family enzyme
MPRITGLDHVGLAARDPLALSLFYLDLFGMEDVGHAPNSAEKGGAAFLTSRSGQRHQELVFFQEPTDPHIAFSVASLAELRAWYAEVKRRGLPIQQALYHGDSYAFYFADPEGHTIELCWQTGRIDADGLDEPIDLEESEEELLAFAERLTNPPRGV